MRYSALPYASLVALLSPPQSICGRDLRFRAFDSRIRFVPFACDGQWAGLAIRKSDTRGGEKAIGKETIKINDHFACMFGKK